MHEVPAILEDVMLVLGFLLLAISLVSGVWFIVTWRRLSRERDETLNRMLRSAERARETVEKLNMLLEAKWPEDE